MNTGPGFNFDIHCFCSHIHNSKKATFKVSYTSQTSLKISTLILLANQFINILHFIQCKLSSPRDLRTHRPMHTRYEPSHEKTNIMVSAQCFDPDQPAQSTQDNPGRHIPS